MVSIEVARAEVNSMSGFQRESVYRLSKFNMWLGDRFPLGTAHKGSTPLLQTQEGLIEHSVPLFSLMTKKSKFGRPEHAYLTYEQVVDIALKAGTDVRGMMRAFLQRNALEEEQIAEIAEIADGQLPDDLKAQLPGIIVDGRIRAYHGILY
jgi:hypothetical protein